MNVTDKMLSFIAPHNCVGCGFLGSVLCHSCAAQVQTIPSRCYYCSKATKDFRTCPSHISRGNLFSVRVWGEYSDVLKEVIHVLKYERAMQAGGDLIDGVIISELLTLDSSYVIVPVPTTAQRIRQRGYDQSVLLAKNLSQKVGLPFLSVLRRQGSQHQVGNSAQTRRKQLVGAFEVIGSVPEQILLIDDVLTTGATLEEAARTLKKSGARRIHALVIAQA